MATNDDAKPMHIPVRYWSDEDKVGISRLSAGAKFEAIATDGFSISYADFLSWAVFYEQSNDPGFESHEDLQRHLKAVQSSFELHYARDEKSLNGTRHDDGAARKAATEIAGVGIGLGIASQAYELQQADWQKIPESGKSKTLDYRIASDGARYIEVEVKARRVHDSDSQARLQDAVDDIKAKKETQAGLDALDSLESEKPGSPVERIGIISSLENPGGKGAACWLVDPPNVTVDVEAFKYKLLARMTFYWKGISAISKSPFVLELRSRIDFIRYATNWRELDGRPLLDRSGDLLKFPPSFETTKFRPRNYSAFGDVLYLGKSNYFFYGFDDDIVKLLLSQNFDKIANFKSAISTMQGQEIAISSLIESSNRDPVQISKHALAKLYA
jgi:hypothetical protein